MPIYVPGKLVLDNGTRPAAIAGVAPTLDYRFARDKREIETVSLLDKLTYTGGNGTFVGSDGYIQQATTNVPRFDHDPLSRISEGLLMEESRTNLIPYSEDFGNAAWTKEPGASAVGNRINFPAASNFSSSVGAPGNRVYEGLTVPVSSVCTATLIVPPSANWSDSTATIKFGIFSNYTDALITSKSYWQFICITATDNDTGTFTTAMKTDKALTIDGLKVQLEVGAFGTSYIKNEGNPLGVTRAADSATIDGTGVLTGTYTVVEKPAGCAVESGGNIELQAGYTAERVMVFPASLSAQQITDIRSAM